MTTTATATLLVTFALVLLLNIEDTDAKRGCAAFGHSCYGAMGKKRSELMPGGAEELDRSSDLIFTGPRNDLSVDSDGPRIYQQQLYNLSPFFRQWLQTYRKAHEHQNLQDGGI